MKKRSGAVRSYILQLLPNAAKGEAARYAVWWHQRLCLDYVRELYSERPNVTRSTATLGTLANQAQKRARDMLRAGRAAERATGETFECPKTAPALCDARIRPGNATSFPYWVKFPTGPYIPAQTHRALSNALRAGGQLRPACEIRLGKNGGLMARVFVEYPRHDPAPSNDVLGCDVGVNHGVSTSDGRTSKSLRPIMDRTRARNAERQRQGHRFKSSRSALKQELDREARRTVMLAKRCGRTIAIERLKMLGNLKPSGRIGGWARRHFGERVRQIAEVVGVTVIEVHPAYTSRTCLKCGHVDRKNRRGTEFRCVSCGYVAHADVVGARNVQRKARGVFVYPTKQKGRVTNMIAHAEIPSSAGVSS